MPGHEPISLRAPLTTERFRIRNWLAQKSAPGRTIGLSTNAPAYRSRQFSRGTTKTQRTSVQRESRRATDPACPGAPFGLRQPALQFVAEIVRQVFRIPPRAAETPNSWRMEDRITRLFLSTARFSPARSLRRSALRSRRTRDSAGSPPNRTAEEQLVDKQGQYIQEHDQNCERVGFRRQIEAEVRCDQDGPWLRLPARMEGSRELGGGKHPRNKGGCEYFILHQRQGDDPVLRIRLEAITGEQMAGLEAVGQEKVKFGEREPQPGRDTERTKEAQDFRWQSIRKPEKAQESERFGRDVGPWLRQPGAKNCACRYCKHLPRFPYAGQTSRDTGTCLS